MPTGIHKKRKHPYSTGKLINVFRKIHRITAVYLFVIFFIVSVTGLLLGWKKHSGGIILAESYKGTSSDFKKWLPIDSLYLNASKIFHDSISSTLPSELERIDIRKEDGMIKFVFNEGFWGIQLDGVTGKLLHIERRRADFIEKIHDGSIIDYYSGTNGVFKLVYTSVIGLALLVFTITGFWLYFGPKRLRKLKQERLQKILLRKQKIRERRISSEEPKEHGL